MLALLLLLPLRRWGEGNSVNVLLMKVLAMGARPSLPPPRPPLLTPRMRCNMLLTLCPPAAPAPAVAAAAAAAAAAVVTVVVVAAAAVALWAWEAGNAGTPGEGSRRPRTILFSSSSSSSKPSSNPSPLSINSHTTSLITTSSNSSSNRPPTSTPMLPCFPPPLPGLLRAYPLQQQQHQQEHGSPHLGEQEGWMA